MGAYCYREVARRDEGLSQAERDELMSKAKQFSRKARDVGTSSVLNEMNGLPPSEIPTSRSTSVLNPLSH
jgi:hypothetical protein